MSSLAPMDPSTWVPGGARGYGVALPQLQF